MAKHLGATQRVVSRRPRPVPGKEDGFGRPGLPNGLVAMLVRQQGGVCAVCRVQPASHIDHDHALALLHGHAENSYCRRCIRSVLCNNCNSMLGFARDTPETLEAGAVYVRAWRAR